MNNRNKTRRNHSVKTFAANTPVPVLITADGFALEQTPGEPVPASLLNDFLDDRFGALYRLAWTELGSYESPQLFFLKDFSLFFHDTIGASADIELLRENVTFEPEEEQVKRF
jgi:hypothetical protein